MEHEATAEETPGFTTLLPTYEEVRALIPTFERVPRTRVRALLSTLQSLMGTPQETLDWANPERWIPERLDGENAELAEQIWHGTRGLVNPRYMRGHYYFILRHKLLEIDVNGCFVQSERTGAFLDGNPDLICRLDQLEGLAFLLETIVGVGTARVGELRSEWAGYVKARSNYSADSAIKSLLRNRLKNLESRGLVQRGHGRVVATDSGVEYARLIGDGETRGSDVLTDLMQKIHQYNAAQRQQLRDALVEMDPYAFEFLVSDLLEEMGYSDVTVTSQSGDFGVDVVATVEFGITTITEFVQVKRRTRTLGRKEVDQLRGALPYHGAIRGTLITLGSFSSGCQEAAIFPGAQPITLIDGERLLDLLIKHRVAMTPRQIELHEVDQSYFALAEEKGFEEDDAD